MLACAGAPIAMMLCVVCLNITRACFHLKRGRREKRSAKAVLRFIMTSLLMSFICSCRTKNKILLFPLNRTRGPRSKNI